MISGKFQVIAWRYALGKYSLEIPSGRIEEGDSPEMTAARDLEEEFGYGAALLEKLTEVYVAPGCCTERIHLYLARGLEPSRQSLDDDEEIDIVTLPYDEAVTKVSRGEIDDSKTIVALLMASSRIFL